MRLILIAALVFSSAVQATCCCGVTMPEETLSARIFLRPRPHIVQDHIWNLRPICHSHNAFRGIYINEDETFSATKQVTTGRFQEEAEFTSYWALGGRRAGFGRIAGGRSWQTNKVTGATNFDVELFQTGGGGEIPLGCCWFLSGDILGKWAWQRDSGVYAFQRKVRVEPAVWARHITPKLMVVGAAFLDSFIVRDVEANQSLLLGRKNLFALYEYRWCPPHRAGGVEFRYLHYDDPIPNDEERVSLWYRTGFSQLERFVFFRYEFDYRRFHKTVPQYLSMNHRVTHAGTFTWCYPIAQAGRIQLEYTYGWRRSRLVNDPGQQTQPNGQIVPITLFKQTLNVNRAQARYCHCLFGCLNLDLRCAYYFDAYHYGAYRLTGRLQGSF